MKRISVYILVMFVLLGSGCVADKKITEPVKEGSSPPKNLAYNQIVASKDKYIGEIIVWRGKVAVELSQLSGIKFWVIDEQHFNKKEWFWTYDKDIDNLPPGTGDWVGYILKKFVGTDEHFENTIFEITGVVQELDCGVAGTCVPNIEIKEIKKLEDQYLTSKEIADFLASLKGIDKLPQFKDYPAITVFKDSPFWVAINASSVEQSVGEEIRGRVEQNGINFSGKYSIVNLGCGSTCQVGAMVDVATEKIYPLPGAMTFSFSTQKNSRLLIQNPLSEEDEDYIFASWRRVVYWEWTGSQFKLLGSYRIDMPSKSLVKVEEDISEYDAPGWNWSKGAKCKKTGNEVFCFVK